VPSPWRISSTRACDSTRIGSRTMLRQFRFLRDPFAKLPGTARDLRINLIRSQVKSGAWKIGERIAKEAERTAFFAWRRGAQASVMGLRSWIRAGERKTCWAKPLPVPPGLWALNAARSFAGMPSGHFGQRPQGTDRGGRAFEPSLQRGSDRLARLRGPRWLSLHKRPHPDLAGNTASCGWAVDPGS
jgi:hypothetical protein